MEETTCNIELLPHGRKIRANSGERLLETLVAHNIFLRSDCGGKGVCGKCQVEVVAPNGSVSLAESCTLRVTEDLSVRIPDTSLLSSHIMDKAPAALPNSFVTEAAKSSTVIAPGVAIDLGTTTIALYLCDTEKRTVLSSIAVKNPQALYGDDVMSRIGEIDTSREKLGRLQQLVWKAVEWGIKELFNHSEADLDELTRMVVVGNPTMIHIALGVNPASIGISPYQPAFCDARQTNSSELGLELPDVDIHTLDQLSGFIGGDILAATLAAELEKEPAGTLLIDLGTNGELVLKGRDGYYATSCATGPAFEGAALSCGMQAIPGAIDRVILADRESVPDYTVVLKKNGKSIEPSGLCGSGVISAVAALTRTGIVDPSGRLLNSDSIRNLQDSGNGGKRYVIVPSEQTATTQEVSISQKDIRSVQLGKAALITGIEFLMRAAGINVAEKIIIAGAFGSYLDKNDMLALGMIPSIDPSRIQMAGNAAGAGAIMALCDNTYLAGTQQLAADMKIIELAANIDFQNSFVQRLSFPHNPLSP